MKKAPYGSLLLNEDKDFSMVARDCLASVIDDQECPECSCELDPHREPLIASPLHDYTWQMTGSDLLELRGVTYILLVDYISRYPEVVKLTSTTSEAVITAMKYIFLRHGIPGVVCM